jgi:hypothetical protein
MDDPYLTPSEMRNLTDATAHRCQIEFLKANDWPFVVSRQGRPKVLRSYHDARMNGEAVSKTKKMAKEPNWSKAA